MRNSRVSTGHNGDGQCADFSGFPARGNATRDVGPDPFPRTKSDAVAGIEGRTSPSEPLFAPAAASDADRDNEAFLKIARAM